MKNSEQKQLVAFIDLLGFNDIYELITYQNNDKSKLDAFRSLGAAYHVYMGRLRDSLSKSLNSTKSLLEENDLKTNSSWVKNVSNPHILTISDCIVIAIDCDDATLLPAFTFLSYSLFVATQKIMDLDGIDQDMKKIGLPLICPIRGGISYDYSAVDFKNYDIPYVFSYAYYEAVALEKKAGWPRIIISQSLLEKIKPTIASDWIITKNEEKENIAFLDPIHMITKTATLINNDQERKSYIASQIGKSKKFIELNTKYTALRCTKYSNKKKNVLESKYKAWVNFFNCKITNLINNNKDFVECKKHLFEKNYVENEFIKRDSV